MLSLCFQFLVEHVVEAAEGALLDAARQPSAEKPAQALSSPNIHDSGVDAGVAVEVGQLEPGLDDVERVGEQRACQSGE